MLFRTNQETGPAIDLFQQPSLVSIGQWCGPFARPEFINHSLKLMWNLWRHTRNATFFLRDRLENVGIKRASQKSLLW
jgi:hypothetical protein